MHVREFLLFYFSILYYCRTQLEVEKRKGIKRRHSTEDSEKLYKYEKSKKDEPEIHSVELVELRSQIQKAKEELEKLKATNVKVIKEFDLLHANAKVFTCLVFMLCF